MRRSEPLPSAPYRDDTLLVSSRGSRVWQGWAFDGLQSDQSECTLANPLLSGVLGQPWIFPLTLRPSSVSSLLSHSLLWPRLRKCG